jgi:hypothetical protein
MPTKTTTKTKTKVSGKGLKKKIGPLPLIGWIGIGGGLILLYLFLRHRSLSSTPASGIATTSTVTPTTTVTPQQAASAGAPATSSFDPSSLAGLFTAPSDYVNQTDLNTQLGMLQSTLGADIASVTFPQAPSITIQVPKQTVATTPTKPTVAPQKKATVRTTPTSNKKTIHYFTYKKDALKTLAHGQTLHFTKGKGYYNA